MASDTQHAPQPPPPSSGNGNDRMGAIGSLITAVKGLTFTNALVIALLVIIAVPAYFIYRLVNDQALLDRFLSNYQAIHMEESACTVRAAGVRGEPLTYYISAGFAFFGSDRYSLTVAIPVKPNVTQLHSYCETLNLVIDYLKDPDFPRESPTFPDTNKPIIQKYQGGGGPSSRSGGRGLEDSR